MCDVAVSIPEAVLFDTKMSVKQTEEYVRKSVALCYYTENGVSTGYCAQIAGMTEEEFIKYLGEHQVSVFRFDSEDEFLEELKNA